jgi:hypothetical protein
LPLLLAPAPLLLRSTCGWLLLLPPLLLTVLPTPLPLLLGLSRASFARASHVSVSPSATEARYSLYRVVSPPVALRLLNRLSLDSLAAAAALQLCVGLRALLLLLGLLLDADEA